MAGQVLLGARSGLGTLSYDGDKEEGRLRTWLCDRATAGGRRANTHSRV